MRWGGFVLLMFASGLVAGCGGSERATESDAAVYRLQVASYDVAADRPQRLLVGLLGPDGAPVVGGDLELGFAFFGEESPDAGSVEAEVSVTGVVARFIPVASGIAPPSGEGPRPPVGDEGVGVYEATGVVFDRPGYWGVVARAQVDGRDVVVDTAFEVLAQHRIVNAGDPAPRTANLLPGTSEAEPTAVDSRAEPDGSVPDPQLHQMTVADAIDSGRPTVVVVSTPVFCVSRFCGPITDSVQVMADEFGELANFVHIEVWKDFENNVVNRGAAEWIYPDVGADLFEPWVFLIDGSGTVTQRWDNVANADAVSAAVEELL